MLTPKFFATTILLIFALMHVRAQESFKQFQLRYERVKAAFEEKEQTLSIMMADKGLAYPPTEMFIRAFKLERKFEVWVRTDTLSQFTLLNTYDICNLSGKLGPKRQEGDRQMPEGFYAIEVFNPESSYHLSLGLNYPNESDKLLSTAAKKGGEIYIHGDCVTIGCFPMTDDKMKEIYCLAVLARDNGQEEIPVHVFPTKMTQKNMDLLRNKFGESSALYKFWEVLKPGFDFFESNHLLPDVSVSQTGKYLVQEF